MMVRSVSLLVMTLLLAATSGGCERERSAEVDGSPAGAADERSNSEVLLEGRFQRVAKGAAGSVQLIRRGEQYQLRLRGVSVDSLGEVHVYLVGLPEVKSTVALTAAETKYDFGPLEQGAEEQVIDLPSEPASELRSVVLYEPRYRVNLAAASLK